MSYLTEYLRVLRMICTTGMMIMKDETVTKILLHAPADVYRNPTPLERCNTQDIEYRCALPHHIPSCAQATLWYDARGKRCKVQLKPKLKCWWKSHHVHLQLRQ